MWLKKQFFCKCGDNDASLTTFVATLIFKLDTAALWAFPKSIISKIISGFVIIIPSVFSVITKLNSTGKRCVCQPNAGL